MAEQEDVFEDIHFEEEAEHAEEPAESIIKEFLDFLKNKYKYPGAHKYPYMYPGQEKKYPWQKLKKMQEDLSAKDTEINGLKDQLKAFEDLKKSHEEASKELERYKSAEMEAKVNDLVGMQEGLGMITDQNKQEVLKNFSSMNLKQIESMIEASKKLQPVQTKSFKAPETGEGASVKEIEALEIRIKDFESAGLKTDELEEKLKKLKGS